MMTKVGDSLSYPTPEMVGEWVDDAYSSLYSIALCQTAATKGQRSLTAVTTWNGRYFSPSVYLSTRISGDVYRLSSIDRAITAGLFIRWSRRPGGCRLSRLPSTSVSSVKPLPIALLIRYRVTTASSHWNSMTPNSIFRRVISFSCPPQRRYRSATHARRSATYQL